MHYIFKMKTFQNKQRNNKIVLFVMKSENA